jgi:hypothetical protein
MVTSSMKTYARLVDGRIAETILELVTVNGHDLTLEDRYPSSFIETLVEYDPANPPALPPVPAPRAVVPQRISMRQARLGLLAAGKLIMVDQAIAGLPGAQKEAAQIEWDYSSWVDRDSTIVALLGPSLNLDDQALDALFIAAAAL